MPVRVTTIHSPLPPHEVQRRIQRTVREHKGFWPLAVEERAVPKEFPFAGIMKDTSFKVMRVTDSRNPFLPVIRGTLRELPSGTEIRLVMTLHPVTAVLGGVWFSGMAGPLLNDLWHNPSVKGFVVILLLCLFVAIPFVAIPFAVWFLPETKKAERAICHCVRGRRVGAARDEIRA